MKALTTARVEAGNKIPTWAVPLVANSSLHDDQAQHHVPVIDDWATPPMQEANDLVKHSHEATAHGSVRSPLLDRMAH